MTLSFSRQLRFGGLGSILAHWQPWALIVLGIAGVLLSASAYQAGALRTSLPIMDTLEPVSAVLIGTAVFGERLASSPGGLAVQLCAAATAVAGIVVLGRSPLGPGVAVPAAAAAIRPARRRAGPADHPFRRYKCREVSVETPGMNGRVAWARAAGCRAAGSGAVVGVGDVLAPVGLGARARGSGFAALTGSARSGRPAWAVTATSRCGIISVRGSARWARTAASSSASSRSLA